MADLHDKFFPYDDMNVTVLKALARLQLSVNECEELLEMDSHALMVEHELDHVQADTVRMWSQHEFQRLSAASVSGASARGAANLRDMSKWQPTRTYPIKEGRRKGGVRIRKRRAIKETVADMAQWESKLEEVARGISDMFYDDMMKLFTEDPEMFQGRSTEQEWEQQVVYAQQEIDTGVVAAIEAKIEEIETMLHDGQYIDSR
jgi:hypothetical protein